jgi:hypothetical protein
MAPAAFSGTLFRLRPRLEVMEDRTLLSTFTVTRNTDSGPGSLRQAILDSNAATGVTNTIDFDIPGPGEPTIAPVSPLPMITNPVWIDGFSQPGPGLRRCLRQHRAAFWRDVLPGGPALRAISRSLKFAALTGSAAPSAR